MSKKPKVKRVEKATVPEAIEPMVEATATEEPTIEEMTVPAPVEEEPPKETLADKILAIYNEGLLGNVLPEDWKKYLAEKTGASQEKVDRAWRSLWPLVPVAKLP